LNYSSMTLEELRSNLISDAHKGYPIFIAGALYWFVMGMLGLFMEGKTLALCYLLGSGSIFPLGIWMSRMLKVNILSKNPLGTLGGIIGGIQAFYLPLWIVIYVEHYELIPMAIGLLGASHFLPYTWIYKSKTYLFLSVTMAFISFFSGYVFIEMSFSLLPFSLTITYLVTVAGLIMETRKHMKRKSMV
jgi:hypothetical protein